MKPRPAVMLSAYIFVCPKVRKAPAIPASMLPMMTQV